MSLSAFDASTLHGFVGSPLYARNRVTPNTDAIVRYYNTGTPGPAPTTVRTTFPYASQGMSVGLPTYEVLGNGNAFKDVQPGWNRMTLLVWGVDCMCNPWIEHGYQTYTDGLARQFYAYNETREMAFLTSGSTPSGAMTVSYPTVPKLRQRAGIVDAIRQNRVPLNTVTPAQASQVTTFEKLYRFQRTIKLSIFNPHTESSQLFWTGLGERVLWTNLISSSGLLGSSTHWVAANSTGLNPANPILLNGQQLNLFNGLDPLRTIGIAYCVRSIEADSQSRSIEYTDAVFTPV